MSNSANKRHRTQIFIAQRSRRSASASPPPEPAPLNVIPDKPELAPKAEETPYDVHTRPTLPASHFAALFKDTKSINPFEREHTGEEEQPIGTMHGATAHLGRTAAMLEDAQPLLVQDAPMEELSSWCVSSMASSPEHPVIAWVKGDQLHLRDERTIHHAIELSQRMLTALHHDARYTWFATEQGRLFRFDRRERMLVLATKMPQYATVVMILSMPEQDRLILVCDQGKIYTSSVREPSQIERTAHSLPTGISHGTFDPEHDELILVTTTSKIIRVALRPGMPPKGGSITSEHPIVALHFSPGDRLLHVQQADPDCVITYKWGAKPKRMFAAALPDTHQGIYLEPHTKEVKLLIARGSVLLHTTLV